MALGQGTQRDSETAQCSQAGPSGLTSPPGRGCLPGQDSAASAPRSTRVHNPEERAAGSKGASETPTGNQREGEEPDRGRADAATALRPHGAPTMGKSGEGRSGPQSPLLQVLWSLPEQPPLPPHPRQRVPESEK